MITRLVIVLLAAPYDLLLGETCVASATVRVTGNRVYNFNNVIVDLRIAVESDDARTLAIRGTVVVHSVVHLAGEESPFKRGEYMKWEIPQGQRRVELSRDIWVSIGTARPGTVSAEAYVERTVCETEMPRQPSPAPPTPSGNASSELSARERAAMRTPRRQQEPPPQAAQPPTAQAATKAVGMTNGEVVKLFKAGLGTELVAAKVANSPADYNLDSDSMLLLKAVGLPDSVIGSMIRAQGDRLSQGVFLSENRDLKVWLSDGKNRIPLETLFGTLDDSAFLIVGPSAVVRTVNQRPEFIVPSQLASKLGLFRLEPYQTPNGTRTRVLVRPDGRNQIRPMPVSLTQMAGITTLVPKTNLQPGEYMLTLGGRDACVFAVD